nr:MAG: RNA-dependent RNA polymerase [Hainan phenui-like virus 7]
MSKAGGTGDGVRQAACGHREKLGGCELWCDDYVESSQGLCYLLAFDLEEREDMYGRMGRYPTACDLNRAYFNCKNVLTIAVLPPVDSSGIMHLRQYDHPFQNNTVVHFCVCSVCDHTAKYYDNYMRTVIKTYCPKCEDVVGKEKTYSVYSQIRFTYLANRVGASFSVKNIVLNESPSMKFEMREPRTYFSEAQACDPDVVVMVDGEKVNLTMDGAQISLDRFSQKIKSVGHDYVANCWEESTDRKLSCLGVEGSGGNLSPDFIIQETRVVLEVATCATDSQKAIDNAYNDKVMKYHDELSFLAVKFFVIVVSPQKVKTNAEISGDVVDLLTQRMRKVFHLRQKMIEVLGEDVMDDEMSETERLVKSIFSNDIPTCPMIDDKYKYNPNEIRRCSSKIESHEAVSAAKILLRQFDETKRMPNPERSAIDDYMSAFTPDNTRCDMKRVSNIPFLIPGYSDSSIDCVFEGNKVLSKMWQDAIKGVKQPPIPVAVESVLANKDPETRHLTKRQMRVKLSLNSEEKVSVALSGIGGKAHKHEQDVVEHRERSKMSFHPQVYTEDIEDFLRNDFLYEDGRENEFMTRTLRMAVEQSKRTCCGGSFTDSIDVWKKLLKTDLMRYSMMMSGIFMELAYAYKHWTLNYEFLVKDLGHGIKALIYNPRSCLFVSLAFPCIEAKIWDEGRLGPEMYRSSTHIFTDFASFDNSQLEHFMKFGPYMGSCLIELLNCSESNISSYSRYARECIPNILLLYCNNKTDVEELITSQRYLFMKILEDVGSSPYTFVERFPKVLRSRLTAHYLKRTITLMDYYSANKIQKVPRQGEEMVVYDYINIKSLFSDAMISLNCKINEFYFGYVVSKERNTGKDKTFKVLTKLIKQEQKFRENVKGSIFTKGEDYEEFKTNLPLLKFFSSSFSDILESKFGKDYKEKIMSDFVHSAARTNFSDLATLKVSSRDHSKDVEVPLGGESTEEIFNKLKESFPEEMMKRPFCMESMATLIKKYEEDTGKSITHVVQLAPWCLEKLLARGYFDSDQFDKSQHGGEREIHVLEFMARIVQYFVELVSRTVCTYFPSETTMNPDTKDTFVKDHYAKSKDMFGMDFTTVSKSADATTWCQFHHSSHFAAMLYRILPVELGEFVLAALSLWPRKRLSFPLRQASSLAANVRLETSNKVYMQYKSDFEKGEGMFLKARSNVIEVISGMFQGILHTTSSLYHTMIQEVMKQVIITTCQGRLGIPRVLVTVVEGSDDSGCLITVPGKPSLRTFKILKRLLLWKELVSPYLSVFCNLAKSSIGTHDLIEYNSEWHVRHMIIKPTFRWVSASQELSVTERFIDRFRIYNNTITDCLTGGASSLECAVIQLFQATMHYMLMGLNSNTNHKVKETYLTMLLENPEPIHGFFPFDEDICCGVTGVEFQLYNLYKRTSFGSCIKVLGESETHMDYSPEDLPSWMKTKDMSSVRLKFSNMKLFYKIVERMNLEPLEDAIKNIEEDPSILFNRSNSWSDEQHNLVLKVFSKGVKESISNKSSMLRMAASSAYILTNRCFTDNSSDETDEIESVDKKGKKILKKVPRKYTLLSLMLKHSKRPELKERKTSRARKSLFPFSDDYERILADLEVVKNSGIVTGQYIKRTSKVKLTIIPKPSSDVDVIDMCKRKWFGYGVNSMSRSQFNRAWEVLQDKFNFLSPTPGIEGARQTAKNLNMNIIQMKMFLESMSTRSRSVVLYDSTSKSGSLVYSLSRIYWPNKKLLVVRSSPEDKISKLRSKLFSLLTFWYDDDFITSQCSLMLRTSESLKKPYSEMPNHGYRLKIIADVLRGVDTKELVHRIEDSRKGFLGSFVQQQKGKGKSRKGEGIWQGTVCGIGTRIYMLDNVCTRIVVNALYDTVALGWHFNQFMVESSLTGGIYEEPKAETSRYKEVNSPGCWLTSSGHIVISRKPKGIPIYQDKHMKVVGTEETANMPWHVDINNNNIRVRARDIRSNNVYTILSETITSRDWTTGVSPSVDDPVFTKWAMGEALHMPSFERMLMSTFPRSRFDFSRAKKHLDEGKLSNIYHWNFKKMQKIMRDCIINRGYVPAPSGELAENEVDMSNDVLERFSLMVDSMIDEFDAGLDEEIDKWADEVDAEEEVYDNVWGIELNLEEEVALKESLNLFSEVATEKYFELVDRSNLAKNFSMPSAYRFFSPLDHLNMTMTGETLRKSILNERSSPGLLGVVNTILTGTYRVGQDELLAAQAIELEEEISNISSSISRPAALVGLSLDELRVHIANIQDQIENSSERLANRLRRLLGMYLDREEELLARTGSKEKDFIQDNSEAIILQLIEFFEATGKLPFRQELLNSNEAKSMFLAYLKAKISSCPQLNKSEIDETMLYLSTETLSRGSLQAIGISFQFNLKLGTELLCQVDESFPTLRISVG